MWSQFSSTGWNAPVTVGLAFASWAFFLGPLARALEMPRIARVVNIAGAIVALPTYVILPVLLASQKRSVAARV